MNIVYISSEDRTRKNLYISSLSSFLSKDNKVLVINFEKSRDLEIQLGIEDYIIYDNLDYFSGNCDLNQGTIEIDDNFLLMPSAYKTDKYMLTDEDYESIKNLTDFDYIIINNDENICDSPFELIYITDNISGKNINFYINNTSINKKLNYKLVKQLEDNNITVLGELDITETTKIEELYSLWEVFIGHNKYIYEKTIIERIFKK